MKETDRLTAWWKTAFGCLFLTVVFYRISYTTADPDLWGHLRFGLDVLRDGFLHRVDTYSFTSDQVWINHEWLSELFFASVYRLAGAHGLIAMKAALSMLLFGLLFRRLRRHGFDVFRAGLVLMLALYSTLLGLVMIRPQIFTYLSFLLILMMLKAVEEGRRNWIWAGGAIMLVWTNLHGGFLAGLGILSVWLVAEGVDSLIGPRRQSHPARDWAIKAGAVALAWLATLVNPYGLELLTFLARTATVARPEIEDWRPIMIASPEGAAYLLLVALALFGFIKSRRTRRLSVVSVFTMTALLPFLALRHLPLFALSFAVLAGDHLADALSRYWPRTRAGGSEDSLRLPFIAACLAASAALVVASWPNLQCIQIDQWRVPARSVSLLKDSGVKGNLAVFFNWGQYAIWHLGPQVQVSIDGRRETVYSKATRAENLQFIFGVGDWDAVLDEHPADLALVSKDQAHYNLMRLKPGWELIYEDSISAIFAPEKSPLAERIRAAKPRDIPVDGVGLCFP